MLTFFGQSQETLCSGTTRRDFLRVGGLSLAGLSLADLLRLQAAQAAAPEAGKARAKNVLLIYLGGGQTHHDTYDPKPEAPQEIRGKYGVIPTKVAGIRYTDQMPNMAQCNDLYALVRSQVSGSDHHETSSQWMLTGNYGTAQGGDFPAIGAVVTHQVKPLNTLPPYVAIPRNVGFTWELGKAAWLGEQYESFKCGDPAQANWKVTNLALQQDVSADRLNRRKGLLDAVDSLARRVEGSTDLRSMDTFYQRAAQMVLSEEARTAFDLSKESDKTREMYGKTDRFGMQALLARRLIEANVRFVLLNYGGWDHHGKIFEACDRVLKPYDQAVAALLRDMSERGLLKETLVAIYGDFGRTSKINKDAGRDHWAHAGSMIFAGAGVKGGQVIGATDEKGEYVTDRPVRPPEVAATIYDALGINYHKDIISPSGRPVPILPETEPVHELWG
jgi:uncharacterized protein DUF1501